MSDLRRLLDDPSDEVERALLASASHDGPSPRAGKKTLAALGIGGGLVASGTSAATASAAAKVATSGAAQAAVAAGGKAGIGVLVKWVGIATVGGVATLGVVQEVSQPDEPPQTAAATMAPVAQQPQAAARAAATAGQLPPSEETAAPADEAVERSDEEPVEAAPERRSATAGREGVGGATGLGAEVKRLDQARAAMQGGQPGAALSALAAYDREFPRGALGPEAQVLRIQALSQAGRTSEARALAEAFLARHPASPHARRLRSLIGEGAESRSR